MGASAGVAVRVPVSMRLPAELSAEIDAYADQTGIRRTDAFIHFLQLGLELERTGGSIARLSAVEARLDKLISLVENGGSEENSPIGIASVRQVVSSVAADYPAIRAAYLFGSAARGDATANSDIDLRLIIDRDKGFNLHDLEHFCKAVERQTGRRVDAITAKEIGNKSLAAAIERDGVLIYEREEH